MKLFRTIATVLCVFGAMLAPTSSAGALPSIEVPDIDCSVYDASMAAVRVVITGDVPAQSKLPINLSRQGVGGEEFVFLGARRSNGVGRDVVVATIPDGTEDGRWNVYARVKLADGSKGARVLCDEVTFTDEIPEGVAGSNDLQERAIWVGRRTFVAMESGWRTWETPDCLSAVCLTFSWCEAAIRQGRIPARPSSQMTSTISVPSTPTSLSNTELRPMGSSSGTEWTSCCGEPLALIRSAERRVIAKRSI